MFAPPVEEQLTSELKEESKAVNQDYEKEPVHVSIEEHLTVEVSRDGAVHSSELTGVVLILIQDEQFGRVKFLVDCDDAENVQIQVRI